MSTGRQTEFINLILQENKKNNLTKFQTAEELYAHGVLPMMQYYAVCGKELSGKSIADIGAGSGITGINLALVNPLLSITLIESNARKAVFLEYACKKLNLTNVHIVSKDARLVEEKFDIIILRAFSKKNKVIKSVIKKLSSPKTTVYAIKTNDSKSEEWSDIQKLTDIYYVEKFHVEQSIK